MSDPPSDAGIPSIPPGRPQPLLSDGLDEVRDLLFGEEKKRLSEITRRLEDPALRAEELSRVLPPALAISRQQDDQLAKALIPAVEDAVKESIRKNPSVFLSAILPCLLPSVRHIITRSTATLLLLNLILLGAACYILSRSWPQTQPVAAMPQVVTNYVQVPVKSDPPVVTVVRTNQFSWKQLESEDYKTYIARLRAIGCPEQTIRDLIIADLDNLLAPHVRQLSGRTNELRYWQSDEHELWSQERRALIRQQKQNIDFEKRDIILQLMGIDLVAERLKLQGEEDAHGERLRFLPDDKRSQVRKVMDRYSDRELSIREKESDEGELLSDTDRAELRRIFKERDQEIQQLLTPAEFAEYELWFSPASYKTRDALFGMEATEEEFLAIYNLTRTFEETLEADEVDANDSAARQRWEAAKGDLEDQIKAQLGETRYAEFKRGQDPDYRALAMAATRYSLPSNVADEVYDLKSIAQTERLKVRASASLTEEQRAKALSEMTVETEKAVKGLLGEKAYSYYARRGQGAWIRN